MESGKQYGNILLVDGHLTPQELLLVKEDIIIPDIQNMMSTLPEFEGLTFEDFRFEPLITYGYLDGVLGFVESSFKDHKILKTRLSWKITKK